MKNREYLNVAMKIMQTPWLITPEGLHVITAIFDERVKNGKLSDEEIEIRLSSESALHGQNSSREVSSPAGVGILSLNGPIFGKANLMTELSGATSLETFGNDLDAMLNDPKISSIIMQIDSPGGTSDLVKETGDQIFAGREIKPIYAIADTMTGSAAYWLMSQATAAYSTPSGSVGSVGAYTVHEDKSAADAQSGNKYTFISAGPYKTEGNPHEPLSAAGFEYRQEVINELYEEFVGAIATGRGTDTETVKANYGGGRMMSASKALEAGMIDGIMPFDSLVSNLASQPRQVVVSVGGKQVQATLTGNMLEVADWEHSEPGTGSPPVPAKSDDPEDKAIKGGWRRDPLPLDKNDPNAPQATATGMENVMNEEQLKALMELFGVDTEEKLITAITAAHTEVTSLRTAVAASGKELQFMEQFPEQYKQHMALLEKDRQRDSQVFTESVSAIKRAEGDKMVPTTLGLSALAKDTVTESHQKFAEGIGTVADFEAAVTAITVGVVDYGEHGSSRVKDAVEFDLSTPGGIATARQLFADEVAKLKAADSLSDEDALQEAAKQNPELAQAYRITLPA